MEEKYENRSSNATNRFLETFTRRKQDSNIRDNESSRDGRKTEKNDELLEGKLSKQGIDERRQSAKESTGNNEKLNKYAGRFTGENFVLN